MKRNELNQLYNDETKDILQNTMLEWKLMLNAVRRLPLVACSSTNINVESGVKSFSGKISGHMSTCSTSPENHCNVFFPKRDTRERK